MNKRLASLASVTVMLALPALAGDGLNAPDPASLWPAWQARLAVGQVGGQGLMPSRSAARAPLALFGDWYLTGHNPAPSSRWRGGLRATGGLVLGPLGHSAAVSALPWSVSLLSATDARPDGAGSAIRPYLGVGYAGMSSDGGLSVSADLGLLGHQPGALFGAQGLEAAAVLRMGVNYAF